MKTRMYVVVAAFLILCSGCDQTSRQRLDMLEGVVAKGTEASAAITAELTTVRQGMVEMQATLADPNLAVPERERIQILLAASAAKITTGLEAKAKIDAEVAVWEAKLVELKGKDVTYADELLLYSQALSAFGKVLPPAYGPYVTLAGIIAAAVATYLAKKAKAGEANQKGVSVGLVESVNKLLASPVVTNQNAAKEILKESQEESEIREEVRKLL